MAVLQWDVNATDRKYSTGVDHVSIRDDSATGTKAWAWDGVTALNDNSTGGESNKVYADNIAYLNLTSDTEYGCSVECLQTPDKFDDFDGKKSLGFKTGSIFASVTSAFKATQQPRKAFGLIYRTWFGDDQDQAGSNPKNCAYHFVYNCKASPASNEHATVNESPEAGSRNFEITTTKSTFNLTGVGEVKTAHIEVDCRGLTDTKFAALETFVNTDTNGMPTNTQFASWAATT